MSATPRVVRAHRVSCAGPADVSGLRALLASGALRAQEVIAVLGKTEGNGGRNDFTRELTTRALCDLFAAELGLPAAEVEARIIFSLSGGTEGVVTPHLTVFSHSGSLSAEPRADKRLIIGTGHTRAFHPDEVGRLAQVHETARAVRAIAAELALDGPADIHLVQIKGAIPPAGPQALRCNMVYSRGASALGVALALGELSAADAGRLRDEDICADFSLYSGVASVSAKPGLVRSELMILGNSRHAAGDLVIDHAVMRDILDTGSVRALLSRLGLPCDAETGQLREEQRQRLLGVFAKSEADPRGTVRGQRHTMLSDDDISDTRYSRCVLASLLASITGDPAVYVSTRAEHHGPSGGGPVAMIARAGEPA